MRTRSKAYTGTIAIVSLLVTTAFGIAAWKGASERGLQIRIFHTDSPSRVPVTEVTSRGDRSRRPVAFLVHGFQCNRAMMVPLAKQLAAQGIDAYAVDLPGHGASLERFSEERARDAAREALDAIVAARGTSPDRVVLVGHSYGADVLARIAGEGGARTMVMLGPSYRGGLSRGSAGNLLVLTAEHEHSHVTAFARDMLRDATGGALDHPGQASGDPSRGDARAWQVVPATDHVSLVFSADALERTSSWVIRSLGFPSSAEGPGTASAILLTVLALAAALALASTAIAITSNGAANEGEVRVGPAGPLQLAVICAIALALAVLVCRRYTLLAPLRLVEGERIASLLAVAGVSMVVLSLGRMRWPRLVQIARGIPVAAAAFAIVYLAAVYAADDGIYRLSLAGIAPERLSAAVVLAAALGPFFAFTGGILERVRIACGGGGHGATWTALAAVASSLAVAVAVYLVDARLGRFAAPFGTVCLFGLLVGALLTRAARNAAVGPIFSTVVTAWVIAVGFVRY